MISLLFVQKAVPSANRPSLPLPPSTDYAILKPTVHLNQQVPTGIVSPLSCLEDLFGLGFQQIPESFEKKGMKVLPHPLIHGVQRVGHGQGLLFGPVSA